MKVTVCSRQQAVGVTHDKPWAVISIRNPGMTKVDFACPNLRGVLWMEFDDTDRLEDRLVAFNLEMAREVWDFVQGLGDNLDTLLVHCNLGASRSPGIAAALDKVLKGDDVIWFRTKTPNMRVYRCMLNVANERGLI